MNEQVNLRTTADQAALRSTVYPMFINGREAPSSSGATFASVNPANGKVIAEVYEATSEDVGRAVAAAKHAFENGWRDTQPKERARLLRKLAELIDAKREMLSWVECHDVGKPISASRTWLAGAPATLDYYASVLLGMSGETLNVSDKTLMDWTLREPLGVCGLIVPWNFPLSIALLKLGPALAAGNCVVIKPSEVTPLSTVELGALVAEAGFPPGVVNIVNGPGSTVGTWLVQDPRVAKISFTGGTASGKTIFRQASDTMKRLTMELGGKSAAVVMQDADLGQAVNVAYTDIVRNSGQVCGACTRVMLHEAVADEFTERLAAKLRAVKIGLPDQDDTEMGPLVSETQLNRVKSYLEIGAAEGARPESYGNIDNRPELADGCFQLPILFQDANNGMRTSREEIFGPVLSLIPFSSEEQAIEIANDTPYGLAACIFTRDTASAMRLVRGINAGTVCVNTGARSAIDAPFGGFKESGLGKERGKEALWDDTQLKNVRYGLL